MRRPAMPRVLRMRLCGSKSRRRQDRVRRLEGLCTARLTAVILENGVVRTLDPSLPAGRALAIAGAYLAGGVGVHENGAREPGGGEPRRPLRPPRLHGLPRPLPDLVARAAAGEAGRLHVDRGGARARREAEVAPGRWLRGYGWRDGDWEPRVEPTKEMLDAVTGERPAILISKDYHSAWLNSAALAVAGGDLDVHGGVVERDAAGEPTGILREESAWRFRDRYVLTTEDEWVEATRAGIKLADSRGVGGDPRQGRLARRARDLPAAPRRGQPLAPRLGLDPARAARRRRRALAPLRLRRRVPPDRLPEVLHGRHTRLADGADDRRHRRRDHEPRRAGGDRSPRRRARLAGRRSRDRRPGEPERARRVRGDPRCLGADGPAAADRARPVPDTGGSAPLRGARDRLLGAVLARALGPRSRRPVLGRPGRRHLRLPLAARLGAWSRTARTRRSRSSTRSAGSPPACCGRSTSGPPGGPRRR